MSSSRSPRPTRRSAPGLVEDDPAVGERRDREGEPGGDVRLDDPGDDVDRRSLGGDDEVDPDRPRHLGDPADRLLDVAGGHHHEVVQLVDDDEDVRQPAQVRPRAGVTSLVGVGPGSSEAPPRSGASGSPASLPAAGAAGASADSRASAASDGVRASGELHVAVDVAARPASSGRSTVCLGERRRAEGCRVEPAVELAPVDSGVVAGDVAHAALGEQVVAALHLRHRPGERVGGPLRVDHDLGEQVRKAVVLAELDSFRVDEDEADLVGRRPHEDRGDDRVDAGRLAGPGGAGDEQVRHLGEVHHHRAAGDVPAEGDLERVGRAPGLERLEHAAEGDELPVRFGTSTPIAERPGIGARMRTSGEAMA